MSDKRFQNHYRIPSARAKWHDYNGGIYFVTVCTQNREHFFGEIQNGVMHLTEIGKYANEQFQNVKNHYPYAEIPLWVLMPNHLHAIIVINRKLIPYDRRSVETGRAPSLRLIERFVVETGRAPSLHVENHTLSLREIEQIKGWLSVVVGGLKSSITKFAHQQNLPFAWQPRFHDHIIRGNKDMNNIADYIENNVAKWEYDKFYG